MLLRSLLLIFAITCFASGRLDIGLTTKGSPVEAQSVVAGAKNARTVLLIGGLGKDQSSTIVRDEAAVYEKLPASKRKFHLFAIPQANSESESLVFPPAGSAYKEGSASHYLWRWIGTHAPDLVVIVGEDPFGLKEALSSNVVIGIGKVQVQQAAAQRGVLAKLKEIEQSDASRQMAQRTARTPLSVAKSLESFYGQDFSSAVYVPAMSLMARLRLGRVAEVEQIVKPFVDGTKDSLKGATSSHLPGHLIFGDLAERTGNEAYTALVRRAADLGFQPDGSMKESMPFHDEMSDSVFMGCPILAKAGKLTGDRKYFDMALRHFRFMQSLDRRPDGLYRHSPLHEAAWGRGNAFPALGLALTLSDLPKDHPAYAEMLSAYRNLMAVLSKYQDEESGMWRQVVDKPGAFTEFTSTAMIGRSMLIGIRYGWLEKKLYQPRVEAAWQAILRRTLNDGQMIDVCESTGKQKSLEDYLNRKAILGKDTRGGGMAMMFAVEMAGLK